MPRKRFTNEQIAFALRQSESGTTVEEICRKMGVSEPTKRNCSSCKPKRRGQPQRSPVTSGFGHRLFGLA